MTLNRFRYDVKTCRKRKLMNKIDILFEIDLKNF